MPLIERVSRNLIFWVVILLVLPAQESQAEVITIEASVLSIDPSERTITVDRKGKELTLEIGRNAEVIINNQQSTPAKVTAGQKVEIDYETTFEIVTRIQIGARHQSSQPELIPLTELDADGSEDAPWISSDGKTIYWTVATRSNPKWIWSATRTDANAMFADKGRLFPAPTSRFPMTEMKSSC